MRIVHIVLCSMTGLLSACTAHADGVQTARVYAVPGDRVFPESVDIDPMSGTMFTASAETGVVFFAPPGGDRFDVFSSAGTPGQGGFGVRVLALGDVAIARGASGVVDILNASGALKQTISVENPDGVFLNDIVELPDGRLFVTDSFRPVLYATDRSENAVLDVWLAFEGTGLDYAEGFNLNGIVAAPEIGALIIAQTNARKFWRIDLQTREIEEVDVDGASGGGDGLRLVGNRLFAVQDERIRVFEMSRDFRRASYVGDIISDAFDGPTGVAVLEDSIVVTNAQFARQNSMPNLPFEIVSLPLPQFLSPTIEDDQ